MIVRTCLNCNHHGEPVSNSGPDTKVCKQCITESGFPEWEPVKERNNEN